MTDSVNDQHFKDLVEEYERARSEKNKNTFQTAVGKGLKKMKADFIAADELEKVVRRQVNEWKTLSFTKKSKMIEFWSKTVQTIKSKVANEKIKNQETTESVTINYKTNPQPSTKTPSSTNIAAPTPAQEEVKQKSDILVSENDILVGFYRKQDL